MKIVNVCGHSFAKDLLNDQLPILDCGANRGDFSQWISLNSKSTVHGFEPDTRLFPALPTLARVHFHPLAVSNSGKPLRLKLGETRCSTVCFSERVDQESIIVDSVQLDQFCLANSLHQVDMIKLDIEGAEIDLLSDLSIGFLKNVGQITVEFHDFIDKNQLSSIQNIISRLTKHGFFCIKFSHFDHADVLFINTTIHPISWLDAAIIYAQKYFRGALRIIYRKFKSNNLENIES